MHRQCCVGYDAQKAVSVLMHSVACVENRFVETTSLLPLVPTRDRQRVWLEMRHPFVLRIGIGVNERRIRQDILDAVGIQNDKGLEVVDARQKILALIFPPQPRRKSHSESVDLQFCPQGYPKSASRKQSLQVIGDRVERIESKVVEEGKGCDHRREYISRKCGTGNLGKG